MKLIFKGEFKSLKSFESDELGDLTVITGKNGSGKSQLVELLNLRNNNNLPKGTSIEFKPGITQIQVNGIDKANSFGVTNENWKNHLSSSVSLILTKRKDLELLDIVFSNGYNDLNKYESNIDEYFAKLNLRKNVEFLNKFYSVFIGSIDKNIVNKSNIQKIIKNWIINNKRNLGTILFVAKYNDKKISDLTESDIYNTPIPEEYIDNKTLFNSYLDNIFYAYAKKRYTNSLLYFYKKEYKDKNNSVSDSMFIRKNPPPWDIINKILSDCNIRYRFSKIDRKQFSPEANFRIDLINVDIDKSIYPQDLSTGEQIILNLVLQLFYSEFYHNKLRIPELAVFDEPDASLHPEMVSLLVNTFYNIFVKTLKVKVIFITHSPATIALCPEDSIYQLSNFPSCSLLKISKDDALNLLTAQLPNLSIDYKNHRQIFVESPIDVKYYQTVYNKLSQRKKYNHKLYFISNGFGKGNCNQVLNIVKSLRDSGNKTSFGIIDWDGKNKESQYVKIHGLKSLYSIENFIFDPVYLIILFIELKAHSIIKELNFESDYNQYNFGEEKEYRIQECVDWIFNKIYEIFPALKKENNKKLINTYYNSLKIEIPQWFVISRGHDIEVKLRRVFKCNS